MTETVIAQLQGAVSATPEGSAQPGASADPVFVLCAGRSGSTLLRFLLDAHPDLACPPETNVPALCGQLATVWSLIEGAPLSANRGDEPPEIPDAAIAGVRETMERMTGSYLARRGKKRYCDKSLGTARFAYLMQRIWPDTRFICLYRHPMDVIASGMEACPWGLNGYGFDAYIAETPGNAVHALARFWVDNAATILAAEEEYKDRCHRLRYEDLVADPQAVADSLFEFLGVAPVPGIAEICFAADRERFGPADYKIWNTSRISSDSVGRGWTVPAGLIGPQVHVAINELCGKLGYLSADENWGTADKPVDLRLPPDSPESEDGPPGAEESTEVHGHEEAHAAHRVAAEPGFAKAVSERLSTGLARIDERFASRWEPCGAESFLVVATPADGGGPDARWWVDLAARTVTAVDGAHPAPAANGASTASDGEGDAGSEDGQDPATWDIIASADTWEQVMSERTNLSVALRRHQMRYCEPGEPGPFTADTRMGMLADLLGLASWGQARPTRTPPQQAREASGAAAPS
jgi:hypothetical protein